MTVTEIPYGTFVLQQAVNGIRKRREAREAAVKERIVEIDRHLHVHHKTYEFEPIMADNRKYTGRADKWGLIRENCECGETRVVVIGDRKELRLRTEQLNAREQE